MIIFSSSFPDNGCKVILRLFYFLVYNKTVFESMEQ